jgi:histidinol dehydrogenase
MAQRLFTEAADFYQERQRPSDEPYEDAAGVLLGHRWTILKTGSEALPELGHVIRLVPAEGPEAHARSLAIRLSEP